MSNTRIYWLHALTPTHAGIGRGVGYIDLPIDRDGVTGWPIIRGSGFKGVWADYYTQRANRKDRKKNKLLRAAFGIAGDENNSNAGALIPTDARLVCLPIRSFRGTFAWCTSPFCLQMLRRTHELVDNLRAQIDSDVRAALLNLQSSADLVKVARSNIDLAEQTLTQSRDRFSAGVTDTVEVTQSQESVASAHEQYISSLYNYNYAKISLVGAYQHQPGAGREGIFQRKMSMAEENPLRSEPQQGRDPPADTSPLADRNYVPPARRNPNRRRNIVIAVVALVVIVAGIFLWRYLGSYESTDDAQADVHLYPVSARIWVTW